VRRDVKADTKNTKIGGEGGSLSVESVTVYSGIELLYLESVKGFLPSQCPAAGDIMQINYCRSGQLALKSDKGDYIYLNPGDFSVHMVGDSLSPMVALPVGQYSGLVISADLGKAQELSVLFNDADIFTSELREKFSRLGSISFFAGNEHTKAVFSHFYNHSDKLRLPYQRIKTAELLLYLAGTEQGKQDRLTSYRAEQVEMIREIHDRLIGQMGERITIEELSKQYLINSTTLKAAFKSVYGESIAAHIKEHRMEKAAKLLRESDMSIAEIAQAVGYDSQSKFTAAFKTFFHVLPREYKKNTAGEQRGSECAEQL
jgi:AraC-like DNA-binding protein